MRYKRQDSCVPDALSQPVGTKGIIPYLKTHLNLLNPPDSHQTLRELLRRLHLTPAFPWLIRHHLTFHDSLTNLLQPLETVEEQRRESRAREKENPSGKAAL
ncbi:hypothetical protein Taro_045262, partial [Colocasia esculenta]|nr:hypothetical protein [Colocasia esculenta]